MNYLGYNNVIFPTQQINKNVNNFPFTSNISNNYIVNPNTSQIQHRPNIINNNLPLINSRPIINTQQNNILSQNNNFTLRNIDNNIEYPETTTIINSPIIISSNNNNNNQILNNNIILPNSRNNGAQNANIINQLQNQRNNNIINYTNNHHNNIINNNQNRRNDFWSKVDNHNSSSNHRNNNNNHHHLQPSNQNNNRNHIAHPMDQILDDFFGDFFNDNHIHIIVRHGHNNHNHRESIRPHIFFNSFFAPFGIMNDDFETNYFSNFGNPFGGRGRRIIIFGGGHREDAHPPASDNALKKLKRFNMEEKFCKQKEDGSIELPNCCICQCEIEKGKETVLLPCGHMYHWDCCLHWLKTNNTCPICRFEIK